MANNIKSNASAVACPPVPSRRFRFLPRLLLAVATPVLVLGGAEWGLRWAGYGVDPGFVREAREDGRPVWRDNPDIGLLWFEPGLARSPVPFTVGEKAANGLRIAVLGESAAMGDPHPAFSLSVFLETILRTRYPDRTVEVINAAMTAIDSSIIVDIARGLAPLQLDLVVVYLGNNEVVGPFGPASAQVSAARLDTTFTRLALRVRSSRLGQALRHLTTRMHGESPRHWAGLETFTARELPPGSPLLPVIHRRFDDNLGAIADAVQASGAEPVFCTMASRINWPPFSGERSGEAVAAETLEADGQWSGAYYLYQQLAEAHPESAEWSYRIGRTRMAMGDVEGGLAAYARSRDLDRLRFRVDSAMNRAVKARADDRTAVLDLERVFTSVWNQPQRYFWDHVHLTPEGNYLAAAAIARDLEPLLGLRGFAPASEVPTFDALVRDLVYTEWDQLGLLRTMHARLLRAPFDTLSYHNDIIGDLTRTITALQRRIDLAQKQEVRDALAGAAAKRPGDYYTQWRLGQIHEEMGQFPEAARVYEAMLRRWPQSRGVKGSYGRCLVRLGRVADGIRFLESAEFPGASGAAVARAEAASIVAEFERYDEALALIDDALRLDSAHAKAWYNRAVIHGRRGAVEEAERDFLKALEFEPGLPEACNNLGAIALKREQHEEAERWFREALKSQPLQISALRNLSVVTMLKGDWKTSLEISNRLKIIDPDFKDVSATRKVTGAGG